MAIHHTGLIRILMVLGSAVLLLGMITNNGHAGEEALLSRLSAASAELDAHPDFVHAHAENNSLVLTYADASVELLTLSGSLDVFRSDVIWAWKSGGDLYFITGGAVDDVWGYVLTRDRTLSLGDVKTLEATAWSPPGYRSYAFSTLKE